jgi:hypothetical protein
MMSLILMFPISLDVLIRKVMIIIYDNQLINGYQQMVIVHGHNWKLPSLARLGWAGANPNED